MLNLLTGCILLGLLHAAIPNHWAPVLAVARAERGPLRRAVGVPMAAGLAHVLSTALTGLRRLNLTGLAHRERRFTGAVLVLAGIAGFFVDWQPAPAAASLIS